MTFPETEAERRALAILKDAELNNDIDFQKIALLIDEAVAPLIDDNPDTERQEKA